MVRRTTKRETVIMEGSRGKSFVVCKCHYDLVKDYKWHILKTGYVARSVWDVGKGKNKEMIYIHRVITSADKGRKVDHANHDPLYNCCWNLSAGSQKDNMINTGMWSHNTSGVRGVAWHKQAKKWRAYITIDGKQKSLGLFDDFDKAVLARRRAVLEAWGPNGLRNGDGYIGQPGV